MAITGADIQLPAAPVGVEDPATLRELKNLYKAVHLLNSTIFNGNMLNLPQYATVDRPAAVEGVMIYDSTLKKACIGTGIGTWEVITSV